MKSHRGQRMVKRTIDVAVAAGLLLVCAPAMLFLALLIRWKMGSPVIFRQQRPGWNEQPFHVCKFRTMNDARGRRWRVVARWDAIDAAGPVYSPHQPG